MCQRDDDRARDADENIARAGRRDERAIVHNEEILRAPLGDMAVAGEHDRLVVAIQFGLGAGEGGVDVDAGDLCARRGGIVLDPRPRRDTRLQALVVSR